MKPSSPRLASSFRSCPRRGRGEAVTIMRCHRSLQRFELPRQLWGHRVGHEGVPARPYLGGCSEDARDQSRDTFRVENRPRFLQRARELAPVRFGYA